MPISPLLIHHIVTRGGSVHVLARWFGCQWWCRPCSTEPTHTTRIPWWPKNNTTPPIPKVRLAGRVVSDFHPLRTSPSPPPRPSHPQGQQRTEPGGRTASRCRGRRHRKTAEQTTTRSGAASCRTRGRAPVDLRGSEWRNASSALATVSRWCLAHERSHGSRRLFATLPSRSLKATAGGFAWSTKKVDLRKTC